MLRENSTNIFGEFVLKFTREIMLHSGKEEIFHLNELIKQEELKKLNYKKEEDNLKLSFQKKDYLLSIRGKTDDKIMFSKESKPRLNFNINEMPNEYKEDINEKQNIIPENKIILNPRVQEIIPEKKMNPIPQMRLRISEPKLSPRLMYLRPIPVNLEIDLGKLNPLVKDPFVDLIECSGEDENIVINGRMGTKNTDINLNKDEIQEIINKFSKSSKIPVQEGIYRVVFGKLMLNAIISNLASLKFVITKIKPLVNQQPQYLR